jgi:hypothetical protein
MVDDRCILYGLALARLQLGAAGPVERLAKPVLWAWLP